jgi:hypothetical protein
MKKIYALMILAILAVGCDKSIDTTPDNVKSFKNIVVLGNSITYAPGSPGSEWIGPWGMAASAPEFDYVHLLTGDFRTKNKSSVVNVKNIAAFERGYIEYDIDANLREMRDTKPDLLIIRIGENAKLDENNKTAFAKRYQDLIAYFKSTNPNVVVLGVGSIWGNELADQVMAKESEFITLRTLNNDPTNYAYGKWSDIGIQQHPSDKGMTGIEQLIWAKVQGL